MANYDAYVICTTPRSGSTFLCKLLSATGKSGNPDSWFHSPSIASWVHCYLGKSPDDFATPYSALEAVFQSVQERGTKSTGIFGLRLQKERFDFFMQQTSVLHPGIPNHLGLFQAAFGKTLFIYLSRCDKLEQAISYVKATQTGLWHIAPDGTELERLSTPQEPIYDAEEITRCLTKITCESLDWQRWFEREGINPLHVKYDELAKNPRGVLVRIFDRLRLNLPKDHKVIPGVAILTDETNRYWKERYLTEKSMPANHLSTTKPMLKVQ